MAVRRVQMAQQGKSDVPLPPAPPPHPGYAPNAALHAIKRHALEFVNPKAVAVRFVKKILQIFTQFICVIFTNFFPPFSDGRRKGRSCYQKYTSYIKSHS